MLMGNQECVFFQIFYVWLFVFWIAESCVYIIQPYFLLEKSFQVWMIELNMSIFHGISQRKLRLLGAPPSTLLWKPGGCLGAGWQRETILHDGSRRDHFLQRWGWKQPAWADVRPGTWKLIFKFQELYGWYPLVLGAEQFYDPEELTPRPALPDPHPVPIPLRQKSHTHAL